MNERSRRGATRMLQDDLKYFFLTFGGCVCAGVMLSVSLTLSLFAVFFFFFWYVCVCVFCFVCAINSSWQERLGRRERGSKRGFFLRGVGGRHPMARDRMAEFISLVPHRGRGAASHGNIYGGNVNNGCEGTERSAMWLPIDDETRPIFTSLSKIRQQVEALEALHVEQLVEMCARKREAVHDAVERICSECHLSREMIHKYNRATKQLAEGVNTKHRPINTAELRMRHNIAMFMECQLMQNVRTMWMEQKAQEERLVDATARRLKARFGVVGNSVNENFNRGEMTVEHSLEIARRLVATGNEDRSFSLARDELERVTRTRDAVLELEQEMQDLLQLFSDLQLLLQGQHEQLILIQQNVEKSCQNLVASSEHLQAAKQHKKKSCCVLQ